jgi:hypothetical protein
MNAEYNKTSRHVVEHLRRLLHDPGWRRAHCNSARDFTRERQLNFETTLLLVLQKSSKSIQLHLNEFFADLAPQGPNSPTPSAWTQTRSKLAASACLALNQEAVLEEFYLPDNPQQDWCGHRLLATDGSELHLPDSAEMGNYFGWIQASNQRGPCGERYILGRISVLYDVNHRLVLEGVLSRYSVGEIDLAEQHLARTQTLDVVLYDRGYCGYEWLAKHHLRGRHYICRVPRGSFADAEALFVADVAGVSRRVWLEPPPGQRAHLRALGIPLRIEVRLVTVRLPSGELEVLATSLLDEAKYVASDFGEAYRRRWGVEPFYGLIKGRLGLENFSGRTVESVRQDFQATLLITNLESVLCREPQAELHAARLPEQPPVKVNHAVSFNALKNQIITLLYCQERPVEEVLDKLRTLFRGNPVWQRPGRVVPRRPENPRRSLNFIRFKRKMVF